MKLFTIAIMTLATTSALAAKSSTEYYFQPASAAQAVELRYDTDNQPGSLSGGNGDFKAVSSDFQFQYAYGLNENIAIGAYDFYGSNKNTIGTQSTTGTGLGDLHLFLKGFSDMWHYGVDLGYNVSGHEQDDATTQLPTNRTTGGPSLTANVGFLMSAGAWNYGGDLSYTYFFEQSIDVTGATDKQDPSGTLKIAPFTEYNYGMGFIVAELSYNMIGDTTYKPAGATSFKFKGEQTVALKLKGTYNFNDMWTGLLGLGLTSHTAHDYTDSDGANALTGGTVLTASSYTETDANIGVRINF